MKNYSEFCKEQTEKLLEIIDQHQGLLQWQKTWSVKANSGLPKGVSGFYRGVNIWKLLVEQTTSGYGSAIWLTYNQIKQKSGHVLKGAKGKQVCFFKMMEIQAQEAGTVEDKNSIPLFRTYTVFNLDQTSLAGQGIIVAEQLPEKLDRLVSLLGVNISTFGNQPRFQPAEDVIVMPSRECFNSPADYDITLCHELIHWVGHESRLNRSTIKDYGKCDSIRAEEELIAEIGSVLLAGYFGIAGDLLNHASYVSSWKKLLDAKAVGRAIAQASKAFGWMVGHIEGDRETAV